MAYADLGVMYAGLNEAGSAAVYAKKAYQLRDLVTDRERFLIDWAYDQYVTGDLEKAAQVCDAWKQTYPRDMAVYINLGLIDSYLGRMDRALSDDLQAMRMRSDAARFYSNLSGDYLSLGRVNDAKTVLQQARAKKLDESLLPNFYELAFLENDDQKMLAYVGTAKGTAYEDSLFSMQSDTEAYHGRLAHARALSQDAVAAALRAGTREAAAGWAATAALHDAEFGNKAQAKKEAATALAMAPTRDIRVAVAMAFARSGEMSRAQNMVNELHQEFPENTLLVNYWLPGIRAALALQKNDAAGAVDLLQVTSVFELGGGIPPFSMGATLYPTYLRGQAYVALHEWSKAAGEFERIRDHRGLVWNFPTGALAEVQLALAYAAEGKITAAKTQYQDFLALWKDADPDIPILREAEAEYAKLQTQVCADCSPPPAERSR
jgi:Flp pilus assembly protein TadD